MLVVVSVLLALAPTVAGYGMLTCAAPALWAFSAQLCVDLADAVGSVGAAAMSSPDGYHDAAMAAGAAAASAGIELGATALARRYATPSPPATSQTRLTDASMQVFHPSYQVGRVPHGRGRRCRCRRRRWHSG